MAEDSTAQVRIEENMPEEEIPLFEDWDYGYIRAMSPAANAAAKIFGYKAIHGLVNGEAMESSPVAGFDGTHVLLLNGKKIKLGEPKKDYVEWCKMMGLEVPTKEKPFKIWGESEITQEQFAKRQKELEEKARKISGQQDSWTFTR